MPGGNFLTSFCPDKMRSCRKILANIRQYFSRDQHCHHVTNPCSCHSQHCNTVGNTFTEANSVTSGATPFTETISVTEVKALNTVYQHSHLGQHCKEPNRVTVFGPWKDKILPRKRNLLKSTLCFHPLPPIPSCHTRAQDKRGFLRLANRLTPRTTNIWATSRKGAVVSNTSSLLENTWQHNHP